MPDTSSTLSITVLTGPLFISVIIDWALFGVLSTQVYYYSQVFPNDRRTLKAWVYIVFLLELAQTLLRTVTSWNTLASGFGNIEGIDTIGLSWLSLCVTGGSVGVLVQWFYAHRLAILSESKTLAVIIVLTSTIAYAGALASAIIAKHAGRFSILLANHRSQIFASSGVWGGTAAFCDVVITISTCYYLQRQKKGAFHKNHALLSKIIRMTVETGAITAPLFATFDFYAVAMLAVLNNRMHLVIASGSPTWRDNELVFAELHPTQDRNEIDLNITTAGDALPSASVFAIPEQVTTTA